MFHKSAIKLKLIESKFVSILDLQTALQTEPCVVCRATKENFKVVPVVELSIFTY